MGTPLNCRGAKQIPGANKKRMEFGLGSRASEISFASAKMHVANAVRFVWHEPWRGARRQTVVFGVRQKPYEKTLLKMLLGPRTPWVMWRSFAAMGQQTNPPRLCPGLAWEQVFHQVGQIVEASLYQVNTNESI
jgi:hypothetical protein